VVASGAVALADAAACLALGRIDGGDPELVLGLAALRCSRQTGVAGRGGFGLCRVAQIASVVVRLYLSGCGAVFALLIVWVTDIGGYVAGLARRAEALAEGQSKKTWGPVALAGSWRALSWRQAFACSIEQSRSSADVTKGPFAASAWRRFCPLRPLGDLFESR